MINKIVLTGILCLFILSNSFAQKNTGKSSLSINLGGSFPVGDFAGKQTGYPYGSFAHTGQAASISYVHSVSKNFGLTATLYGQRNPVNTKSMDETFSRAPIADITLYPSPEPTPPPTTYTTYPNWKFEKRSWKMGALLLGVNGEFPFEGNRNFSFVSALMAGPMHISWPGIKGESITDTVMVELEQEDGSLIALSYLVRAGLKYKTNSNIGWQLTVDYVGSGTVTFDDTKTTFTSVSFDNNGFPVTASQAMVTRDVKRSVNSINVSLGVVFGF